MKAITLLLGLLIYSSMSAKEQVLKTLSKDNQQVTWVLNTTQKTITIYSPTNINQFRVTDFKVTSNETEEILYYVYTIENGNTISIAYEQGTLKQIELIGNQYSKKFSNMEDVGNEWILTQNK